MKFPDDIRKALETRYRRNYRSWLQEISPDFRGNPGVLPLSLSLDPPVEKTGIRHQDVLREWIKTWRHWAGPGEVVWEIRRWKNLGVQELPAGIIIRTMNELTALSGTGPEWEKIQNRCREFLSQWPSLEQILPKYAPVLGECNEDDYTRLRDMLLWLTRHGETNLYPRQIPIPGMDSKWLEQRKKIITPIAGAIKGIPADHPDIDPEQAIVRDRTFYRVCGLRAPPRIIRIRLLDPALRSIVGGLGDMGIPLQDAASLNLPVRQAIVVENLQTGLAFTDIPGTVLVMGLGYHVSCLGRLPWLRDIPSWYWGDLDSHGFAILHRARKYLPRLISLLMDEETFLFHRALWVEEKSPSPSLFLDKLDDTEQALYRDITENRWGFRLRLEQERIAWDYAWKRILKVMG